MMVLVLLLLIGMGNAFTTIIQHKHNTLVSPLPDKIDKEDIDWDAEFKDILSDGTPSKTEETPSKSDSGIDWDEEFSTMDINEVEELSGKKNNKDDPNGLLGKQNPRPIDEEDDNDTPSKNEETPSKGDSGIDWDQELFTVDLNDVEEPGKKNKKNDRNRIDEEPWYKKNDRNWLPGKQSPRPINEEDDNE